jgi:molybdopterin-guanine dinucleotide biosynthesis protein A
VSEPDRTGVVLAGGYSTRFGEEDKALAAVDGEPMVARVARHLSGAVDTVVVSCRADQRDGLAEALAGTDIDGAVAFAVDPEPDRGPLAGIENSFGRIESEYAAVVACDMPGVDSEFLEFLFERAVGRNGAVPVQRDGTLQPLQAVYRVPAMRSAASEELATGRGSLHGALGGLDITVVAADTVAEQSGRETLADVNTRDELRSFAGEKP